MPTCASCTADMRVELKRLRGIERDLAAIDEDQLTDSRGQCVFCGAQRWGKARGCPPAVEHYPDCLLRRVREATGLAMKSALETKQEK